MSRIASLWTLVSLLMLDLPYGLGLFGGFLSLARDFEQMFGLLCPDCLLVNLRVGTCLIVVGSPYAD